MKTLLPKTIFLFAILFMVSCGQKNAPEETLTETLDFEPEIVFASVEDIQWLELDKKFDIPQDIYQDFLDHAIFFHGELAGVKHTEIENILTDEESLAFWSNFGVVLRDNVVSERYQIEIEPRPVYRGKRPIGSGCEPNNLYTCFGRLVWVQFLFGTFQKLHCPEVQHRNYSKR
ncbi:MAG: hypothetical protein AAGG75_25335, partial [Bacteroidota bacterium]